MHSKMAINKHSMGNVKRSKYFESCYVLLWSYTHEYVHFLIKLKIHYIVYIFYKLYFVENMRVIWFFLW